MDGICSKCGEHTTVHEACCGHSVIVEGSTIDPGDYCWACGDEINRLGECDRCFRGQTNATEPA